MLCTGAGIAQALTWVKETVLNDLQQYLKWIQQTIATPPANISLLEMALRKHIHVDRSNALVYLPGIARNYKLAIDALHNSEQLSFQNP